MSRPSRSEKDDAAESTRQRDPVGGWDTEDPDDMSPDPWGTVIAVGISLFLVLLLCAITYFIGWARQLPFSHH
jgi:hypothetical protein